MAYFQFHAVDPGGKRVTGVREADDSSELSEKLRHEQLTVISIEPHNPDSYMRSLKARLEQDVLFVNEPLTLKNLIGRKKPTLQEIAISTRQIATLLNAGITLKDAFRIVISSSEKSSRMRDILADVDRAVQQGIKPETALRRYPEVFSTHYQSLISVGMSSGKLHEAMNTLSSDLERENALRKKVYAALTYPLFTFIFSFFMNMVIFIYVFPRIILILQELKVKMPLVTRGMILAVNILTNPWYLALAIIILTFVYLQFRYYIQTPVGKYHYDKFKLHVPVLGAINRILFLERFGRTMSMLLRYGVTLREAVSVTAAACANVFLVDCLFDVIIRDLSDGREFVDTLKQNPYIPPNVTHLVVAGIASGNLAEPFRHVSHFYEMELENALQRLLTLIEPLMIIIMSAVIFATIISIMLPLYQVVMRMGA